jgi:hypothetical protein
MYSMHRLPLCLPAQGPETGPLILWCQANLLAQIMHRPFERPCQRQQRIAGIEKIVHRRMEHGDEV